MPERQALRQELRRRRTCLCGTESRAMSRAAWLHLFELPAYRGARRLLVYVDALDNEVHTSGILADALERGIEVYTPVVHRRDRRLTVSRLVDLGHLEPGPFGIPEVAPQHRSPADPVILDAAVVPGLAFDRRGNRLGMGQGYFDRFLAGLQLWRIGLAYSFQLVPEVPVQPWDVPMHFVVTDAGVWDCSAP